jgi:hypothetical protein
MPVVVMPTVDNIKDDLRIPQKVSAEERAKREKARVNDNIDYLNHQMFWFVLFSILVANLSIWLFLGT